MSKQIPRIARLNTAEDFRSHVESLGIHLPFDEVVASGSESPLAVPFHLSNGRTIGNRFAIHPMEGWDGTLGR